ncbi:hypothetical protein LguiA_010841 [Lonicera macranthoides]
MITEKKERKEKKKGYQNENFLFSTFPKLRFKALFDSVMNHLSQKLKLLGSGPTMYIMLFNTPPHVRATRTWIDKRNQRYTSCTNNNVHTAQTQRGKQMQAGGFEPETLQNLTSDTML